ncbi:MAG: hypothetical protein ACI9SK_000382 [Zhongshania sp.]|jgi:hypothetical protein
MPFLSNILVAFLSLLLLATTGVAAPLTAQELAVLVAQRPTNEGLVGTMGFRLQNQSGSLRERQAQFIVSTHDDLDRIAIFFTEPAMIEETAFLSFDHANLDDESWLYLPATDRVRRLPSSDRGDSFMGTDLTFGDVKDSFKFGLEDWVFKTGVEEVVDGITFQVLEGTPSTPEIAKEMGYGHFRARIDTATRLPVMHEFSDIDMAPLKRFDLLEVGQVGGMNMVIRFTIKNLQTGHSTDIHYTDMRSVPDLDESLFDPNALAYGIPDVRE